MNNAARKDAPDYAALAKQLEELNAKATVGPWCAFGEHWADDGSYEEPYIFTKPHTDDTIKTICLMRVGLPECGIDNADLIVALRNNLPAILAALEAAQQVQTLQKQAVEQSVRLVESERRLALISDPAVVDKVAEQSRLDSTIPIDKCVAHRCPKHYGVLVLNHNANPEIETGSECGG